MHKIVCAPSKPKPKPADDTVVAELKEENSQSPVKIFRLENLIHERIRVSKVRNLPFLPNPADPRYVSDGKTKVSKKSLRTWGVSTCV